MSRSGLWPSFRTLDLDGLPDLTLMQRSDGSGTIRFGQEVAFYRSNGGVSFGSMMPSLDSTPQFLAIENVRQIFDEIQQRVQTAKGR